MTVHVPNVNRGRLLDRFLRYVRIDTTANDATEEYPSSPGQWELGRLLTGELTDMGIEDVQQTEHGLVYATIPPSPGVQSPTVALIAHLDTSPETSGKDVAPQVIRNYQGGDIVLPVVPERVIKVEENPELQQLIGCTLITTDGRTLLGADDKAGVAIIMEVAHCLLEHPQWNHGRVRILFTCDEEIGRGVSRVDLQKLNAHVGYTLDGKGANEVDVETFSADLAVVTVHGVNIHPSIAKGRMVNAVRAAAHFLGKLPHDKFAPEVTAERQGFLHPYQIAGGVATTTIRILLRDFQTDQLAEYARWLYQWADDVVADFPGCKIDVKIQPQYRNLRDGLIKEPRAVAFALEAHRNLGRQPRESIIRGGTDGSILTERGLPTPNLSSAQHNPHSPLEWACLEEMVQAAEVVLELLRLWARCSL